MKEAGFDATPEGLVRRPYRCDLARDADHPRRPAASRPDRLRRGGRPARGRDRLRAPGRPGGGEALHLDADVPALVPVRPAHDRAAQGRGPGARRGLAFSLRRLPRHAASTAGPCRSPTRAGCSTSTADEARSRLLGWPCSLAACASDATATPLGPVPDRAADDGLRAGHPRGRRRSPRSPSTAPSRASSRSSSYGDAAPIATASFVALARCGFYDGIRFHRVLAGFVIQAGDPQTEANDGDFEGIGSGGPGYGFEIEPPARGPPLRPLHRGHGEQPGQRTGASASSR